MYDVNMTKGFAEIIPETIRNPSQSEIDRRISDIRVKMGHSRVTATRIEYDSELGSWVCDSPEGFVILTSNAHQQLTARQRSTGTDGVVGFSTTPSAVGPVALGTGSDKYGHIPFDETATKVARLMETEGMYHTPTELTISPAFVRVLYEVEKTEIAGDDVTLGWGWQTSHDGSSSLRIFDRVERLICSNGMRATVNDDILKLRHVWGGMLAEHRRSLARTAGDAMPERVAKYLATHSQRKMQLKANESILEAIDRQIDSGRFTIQRAEQLANIHYHYEEAAWAVTRPVLDWLVNEEHANTLRDTLGLKQDMFKALKQYGRETTLISTVKGNLRKYGEPYDYSAWSIVQALNDRPTLNRMPVSLADSMESLSNAVLTNWEQVVQTVRPVA